MFTNHKEIICGATLWENFKDFGGKVMFFSINTGQVITYFEGPSRRKTIVQCTGVRGEPV